VPPLRGEVPTDEQRQVWQAQAETREWVGAAGVLLYLVYDGKPPAPSNNTPTPDEWLRQVKAALDLAAVERAVERAAMEAKLEEAMRGRQGKRTMPSERPSITHKFDVAGNVGYLTVGMYPDGSPGEVFVTLSKVGSTMAGMMDVFSTAVSVALQYGAPIDDLVEKFSHQRFEPSGWSGDDAIGHASSIVDYLFRWIGRRFGSEVPKPPVDLGGQR
jgi:hypothetical protein